MMDKIVDICDRIESKKQKIQAEKYRGKLEAIQKLIQCSACNFRCAMCGHHVDVAESSHGTPPVSLGFSLCETCRDEFEDFLSVTEGGKTSDVSWHNEDWVKMWSAWLSYRRAITGFINSREFKRLMQELSR